MLSPLTPSGTALVYQRVHAAWEVGEGVELHLAGRADLHLVDVLSVLHLDARRRGAELRLAVLPPDVRRLLSLTGLAELLCQRAKE